MRKIPHTAAIHNLKGQFEQTHGGTLLLDEVGVMSAAMQVKLLRAILGRQIMRVADGSPIAVNIRLICASHRDLKLFTPQMH
jgi:two-component system, NtrC family, response regulator HydG